MAPTNAIYRDQAGQDWIVRRLAICVACGERAEEHPVPVDRQPALVPGCVGCYDMKDLTKVTVNGNR